MVTGSSSAANGSRLRNALVELVGDERVERALQPNKRFSQWPDLLSKPPTA
jgi:hypothetical protein